MNYSFNEQAENMARDLIDKHHPHLSKTKIAYMSKDKKAEVAIADHTPVDAPRPKKRGRKPTKVAKVWIAKCTLVNGKYRLLFDKDYHFIITTNQEIWDELTLEQQEAVIDHELCHAVYDEEGRPRLRRHDLEEFRAVVARHGLYMADVEAMAQAFVKGVEKTTEAKNG